MVGATLMLALAVAGAGAGAPVGHTDYSRMPAYDDDYEPARELEAESESEGLDYRARPPYADIDYKDNDGISDKAYRSSDMNEREINSWQSSPRREKRIHRVNGDIQADNSENFNSYYEDFSEETSRENSGSRILKRRPHLKNRNNERSEYDSDKYPRRYHRRRDGNSDLEDKDDSEGNFEASGSDRQMGEYKMTSDRAALPRPRGRHARRKVGDAAADEEIEPVWRGRDDTERERELRRPRPPARSRSNLRRGRAKEYDDDFYPPSKNIAKQMNYGQYGDYYDMKRVKTMKDRLPSIIRRTQEPYLKTQSAVELLADERLLLAFNAASQPARRRGPFPSCVSSGTELPYVENSSIPLRPPIVAMATRMIPPLLRKFSNSSKKLSVAEKSRLSLSIKAEKQPVTMVWVGAGAREGAGSDNDVSADPPGRLARVKALMRRKLVASSRSPHDPTVDRDDFVCDYIDISLFDNLHSAESALCTSGSFVSFLLVTVLLI